MPECVMAFYDLSKQKKKFFFLKKHFIIRFLLSVLWFINQQITPCLKFKLVACWKKKSLAFVCEKAEAPQVYLKVIQKMV